MAANLLKANFQQPSVRLTKRQALLLQIAPHRCREPSRDFAVRARAHNNPQPPRPPGAATRARLQLQQQALQQLQGL